MNISKYYFEQINNIIRRNKKSNEIFVLQGITEECLNLFSDDIILDKKTFLSERKEDFTKEWFANIFVEINKQETYCLISYIQLV